MEGPLEAGMSRTDGDTQEVDFFSPQALLEAFRAMSEGSGHPAQEPARRPCSTSPNVVVTSTLGGAAPSMLPAGTGGDMQVVDVSASESLFMVPSDSCPPAPKAVLVVKKPLLVVSSAVFVYHHHHTCIADRIDAENVVLKLIYEL